MSKQPIQHTHNHDHLYRPFPYENPESRPQDNLTLDSNCSCPPCQSRPEQFSAEIVYDRELQELRSRYQSRQVITQTRDVKEPKESREGKESREAKKVSDYILFFNQIYKQHQVSVPNIQTLDTIVFNNDGTVKYILLYEAAKLKISKPTTSLKNFLQQRKYNSDLEYQKKKFQRQHLGFSFTQLDHQSEKYIKQFESNIKYMNPLLNRVVIAKFKNKQQQQILTQNQLNSIFVKITRKLFDFTSMQYMQIFPIMYGHEQNSYIRKVKYFREREIHKKNFKIAEHYLGNWFTRNSTLEDMEAEFVKSIRSNQEQLLMYYTYKIFIYFQKIANKMVESALVSYITNDQGNSFSLKNIEYLCLFNLHQVQQHVSQLPRKLQNNDPTTFITLKPSMKSQFDTFQLNYNRLERERIEMENKLQADIDFSNKVYQSLGKQIQKGLKGQIFVKSIEMEHGGDLGKIQMNQDQSKQLSSVSSKNLSDNK